MGTKDERERDAERFRWLLAHYKSIGFASGDREPDMWVRTDQLRQLIDEAMKRPEKL